MARESVFRQALLPAPLISMEVARLVGLVRSYRAEADGICYLRRPCPGHRERFDEPYPASVAAFFSQAYEGGIGFLGAEPMHEKGKKRAAAE